MAKTSHADTDSETHKKPSRNSIFFKHRRNTKEAHSRDNDDIDMIHLMMKNSPTFWDLFNVYPEFGSKLKVQNNNNSGSSDDTNSQAYPQYYASEPSSSSRGCKSILTLKFAKIELHSRNMGFNCYYSNSKVSIITIS